MEDQIFYPTSIPKEVEIQFMEDFEKESRNIKFSEETNYDWETYKEIMNSDLDEEYYSDNF